MHKALRSPIRSSTSAGLVRHDGSARTEPTGERNDWSRRAQTKAVKRAFRDYGSTHTRTLEVTGRTFGIR